ncbi:MAG TPA: hypothetical protein VH879_01530 [Gemmatimonadales bacterium]|jgi:hypothetical protein
MEIVGRVFAVIGAGGILGALTFVSLLIGVLITGMITLMAGKLIDAALRRKGEDVYEPGSAE